MALVSRDSFARQETHKERVYTVAGCQWCGQKKRTRSGPSGQFYLYRYSIENDAGRKSSINGLFCSLDCMRSYHN